MDGFAPYRPGRASGPTTLSPRRGLRVPDFNAPAGPDPALEEAERAERHAMLAAARAEGRAEGLAQGRREADETQQAQIAAALRAMATALQDAAEAATLAVNTASDELATLLLAALDAALPAASARLAADTATLLARAMKPVLEEEHALTIAVAPGLAAACAEAIGDARITLVEDAALAPGDAVARWRGGEAAMELARQRAKVAEVLHALGLEG